MNLQQTINIYLIMSLRYKYMEFNKVVARPPAFPCFKYTYLMIMIIDVIIVNKCLFYMKNYFLKVGLSYKTLCPLLRSPDFLDSHAQSQK